MVYSLFCDVLQLSLYLVTDVSEQPIGPIFMDAAVQITSSCVKPLWHKVILLIY